MDTHDEQQSIERPIESTIYSVEITNGYVFRQIFEIYDKLVMQGIPIFFKEDGITIRTGTSSTRGNRKLISDIEIFTDDVIEYYLNPKLATFSGNEDECACCIEQFNINTIRNIFKSIAKSNSVRIYKTTASSDIFIDIKGLTTEHSRVTSNKFQSVDYNFSAFDNINEKPNIKIEINQFCASMKGMTRGDPEYTSFKVFKDALIVESRNGTGNLMKDGRWGEISNEDIENKKYAETRVNSSIIKALCKINGMVNYSIIKLYSQQNGLLKLSHKIGDFGEHNIYLIDNS
jgi:hypothetical protein